LVDILLKVSHLVEDLEEIQEMDLNPVLVREIGFGSIAVDARIIPGQSSVVH
ncbi:MAG: acetate--CoA ligase family protein, partial [Chloroflexi bacterium]|nr:acetate--CoA ligase family protein [Chloroflexota bacterium]